MKTEKRIFTAFILNLTFAVFELFGGLICGSFSLATDAIHDLGDASAMGVSFFLEKKSGRPPDDAYTFGYGRFSLLGSFITSMILILGSVGVMIGAFGRVFNPVEINHGGMTVFAVIGFAVNLTAVLFTRVRDGASLNLRAVNLHMLEDVLGWAAVLVGSLIIRFTGLTVIDPLMSLGISVFILVHAAENLLKVCDVFLGKTPGDFDVGELKRRVSEVDGVTRVSGVRIVNLDGSKIYAALHLMTDGETENVKDSVRDVLREYGICEVTLEVERVA